MNFILKYGFPLLSGLNSIDQKPLIFRGTSLSRALLKWPLVLLSALFPFYFFVCIPLAHFNLLPSVLGSLVHDHIFRTSFIVCGISTFAFAALSWMVSSGEKKPLARNEKKSLALVAEGLFFICLVACLPCYFLQKFMSMVAPEVFFGVSIMCALLVLCSGESNDGVFGPRDEAESSKMVSITSFWAVVASAVLMLQGLNGHVDLFVSAVVMAGCIGACILARAVEVCWDRPAKDAPRLSPPLQDALLVRADSVLKEAGVAQKERSVGPDSKRGSDFSMKAVVPSRQVDGAGEDSRVDGDGDGDVSGSAHFEDPLVSDSRPGSPSPPPSRSGSRSGSPYPSDFGSGLGAVSATQLDRAGEDCSADGDVSGAAYSERGPGSPSPPPSRSGSRSGSPYPSDFGSGLGAVTATQLDRAGEDCSAGDDVSGGPHSERGSGSGSGSGSDSERDSGFGSGEGFVTADEGEDGSGLSIAKRCHLAASGVA